MGRPPQQGLAYLGLTGFGASGDQAPCEEEMGSATRDMSTQEIRRAQEEALAQQDAGLDVLHAVIVRQKGMAEQIGAEVNTQNDLIDDIGDRMDGTNARLINTTQNVRVVERKDRTCGYWVVIVILFIAIVVVAVV